MTKRTFTDAYLSGWFSNYICQCGFWFGPDGLENAKQHFEAGHYEVKSND